MQRTNTTRLWVTIEIITNTLPGVSLSLTRYFELFVWFCGFFVVFMVIKFRKFVQMFS